MKGYLSREVNSLREWMLMIFAAGIDSNYNLPLWNRIQNWLC